ncbi:MAG TPA: hypothetical protein VIM58_03125 [Candidatus Methylacidiphilales bacterium]
MSAFSNGMPGLPLRLAFVGLAMFGAIHASGAEAETILDEHFDAPLKAQDWAYFPDASHARAIEGALTMTVDAAEGAMGMVAMTSTAPMPRLNFLRNSVEIELDGLALQGAPAPGEQVFFVRIGSDSPKYGQAASLLQIRIDGAGVFYCSVVDRGAAKPSALYQGKISWPLSRMKVGIDPGGLKIAWNDAGGEKTAAASFAARPQAWETSVPWLVLVCQRNAPAGEVAATLRGISIRSTPLAEGSASPQ